MEKVGQGRRGSRGMLYVVLACGWHEEVSVAGDIGVWKKGVKGSRNETLEVSTINQPPKLDGQSTFQPLGDFIRIYIYNHPEVHRILVQLNPAAQKKSNNTWNIGVPKASSGWLYQNTRVPRIETPARARARILCPFSFSHLLPYVPYLPQTIPRYSKYSFDPLGDILCTFFGGSKRGT